MSLGQELVSLGKHFQQEGVDMMPLKGIVLATRLYNDPGLRSARDIDLLARPEDLTRAHELLTKHGYKRVSPPSEMRGKQSAAYLERCFHWVYAKDGGVIVELHWRLSRWSNEQMELFWSRSKGLDWMGCRLFQPDDCMLLLSLCDHGSGHRFSRLKWLSDIAMLVATVDRWDWSDVTATAKIIDVELPLAQSFILIRGLFGVPPPTELSELIGHEPDALGLANESLRWMADEEALPFTSKQGTGGLQRLARDARRCGRAAWYAGKLRKGTSLYSRIKPSLIGVPDLEEFSLPDRLFWLYYPLRPFFWIYRRLRQVQ
jgi:hypothetical protein